MKIDAENFRLRLRLLSAIPVLSMLVGCGTLPYGGRWGADATIWPGGDRLKASLVEAVTDPFTWAPVAGAVLLQVDHSFPSEHAARQGLYCTLASRNLRSIDMPVAARTTLDAGLFTLAGAGAWSRVEAGGHYPSDVLVGLAIGRFFAVFFNDAFLGLEDDRIAVEVVPAPDGVQAQVSHRF